MPGARSEPAPWSTDDLVVTASTYGAMLALQGAVRLAAGGPRPEDGAVGLAFAIAPTVGTALVLLRRAHLRGMSARDLGFVRPRSWRPVVVAWLVAVFAGPLTAWASATATVGASGGSASAPAVAASAATHGTLEVAALAVLLSVTVPIVEELIFRGLLHRTARAAWPLVPSAILSGAVFAAAHFDLSTAGPLLIVGFAFAWSYERTGSLWGSIVPHGGLNALTLLVELTRR